MKPDILYLKPFYEPTMAALEREFTVHKVWDIPNGITGIEQRCANVRAAISTTTTEVTRAHFEALPRLELLACYGPYVTLIDHAAAHEHNIVVTHTPDSTAEPVADLAMGLIVAVMRRICEADRFVRSGAWRTQLFPAATEVRGKTCVLIDDMVDTAGTLCKAAQALKEHGAARVIAYCTHAVLSGKAIDTISASMLDELVVTDTIPLTAEGQIGRAHV